MNFWSAAEMDAFQLLCLQVPSSSLRARGFDVTEIPRRTRFGQHDWWILRDKAYLTATGSDPSGTCAHRHSCDCYHKFADHYFDVVGFEPHLPFGPDFDGAQKRRIAKCLGYPPAFLFPYYFALDGSWLHPSADKLLAWNKARPHRNAAIFSRRLPSGTDPLAEPATSTLLRQFEKMSPSNHLCPPELSPPADLRRAAQRFATWLLRGAA